MDAHYLKNRIILLPTVKRAESRQQIIRALAMLYAIFLWFDLPIFIIIFLIRNSIRTKDHNLTNIYFINSIRYEFSDTNYRKYWNDFAADCSSFQCIVRAIQCILHTPLWDNGNRFRFIVVMLFTGKAL